MHASEFWNATASNSKVSKIQRGWWSYSGGVWLTGLTLRPGTSHAHLTPANQSDHTLATVCDVTAMKVSSAMPVGLYRSTTCGVSADELDVTVDKMLSWRLSSSWSLALGRPWGGCETVTMRSSSWLLVVLTLILLTVGDDAVNQLRSLTLHQELETSTDQQHGDYLPSRPSHRRVASSIHSLRTSTHQVRQIQFLHTSYYSVT